MPFNQFILSFNQNIFTQSAAAPAPQVVTPAEQVVKKLNALFIKLFHEKIISGRADYTGDHPEKPVAFHVTQDLQTISTNSWTDGKNIAALFNTIGKTEAVYKNYTGGQSFVLKSFDKFQTLLSTPDEQLKQKLVALRAPNTGYKTVVKEQAPIRMAVSFVDAISGERMDSFINFSTNSNDFYEWLRLIGTNTFLTYGINVHPFQMTALKFCLNGFDPKDPGITYNAGNRWIDLSQFTPKTFLTVSINSGLFNTLLLLHSSKASRGGDNKQAQPVKMNDGGASGSSATVIIAPQGGDNKQGQPVAMNDGSASGSGTSIILAPGGPGKKASVQVALNKFSLHAPTPATALHDEAAAAAIDKNLFR